ncbi:TPA: hypothetical protein MAN53_004050 [Klebsiella pneumoniae]|uniref:hypothetical protein n=1 Tax=Klebsiella pneumoniae TaxID=573 RepID=UPI001119BBB6|nr:hypothetical protein [Klebsiella pneumoniae]HBS6726861.1 hypothetical protein [Klebsiella pneumoniae]
MPAHIKYTEDDVRGKRFGALTGLAIFKLENCNGHWKRRAACMCECGNICSVALVDLMKGHTTSCGCRAKEYRKAFMEEWQGLKGRSYGYVKNKEIK